LSKIHFPVYCTSATSTEVRNFLTNENYREEVNNAIDNEASTNGSNMSDGLVGTWYKMMTCHSFSPHTRYQVTNRAPAEGPEDIQQVRICASGVWTTISPEEVLLRASSNTHQVGQRRYPVAPFGGEQKGVGIDG
jgi:hypothetical protein